jgi:hypothetical protein
MGQHTRTFANDVPDRDPPRRFAILGTAIPDLRDLLGTDEATLLGTIATHTASAISGSTPSAALRKNTGRQSPNIAASEVATSGAQAGVKIHSQESDARACARWRFGNQLTRIRELGTTPVPISNPKIALRGYHSFVVCMNPIQAVKMLHATIEKSRIRFAPYRSQRIPETNCAGG